MKNVFPFSFALRIAIALSVVVFFPVAAHAQSSRGGETIQPIPSVDTSSSTAKPKPPPKPTPTPTPAAGNDGETDWTGTTNSDFNTGTNWTAVSGSAPPAPGDVAWLKSTPANKTINLSISSSIAGLYFNGTAASGYNITSSGAPTFTLTGSAASIGAETGNTTAVAIGAENTSGTNTIAAPIILAPSSGSTSTIFQAGGGTLAISGAISGSGKNLATAGTGKVVLSGTNTYTGTTTVNAGTLQFAKEVSLYNDQTASWTATNLVVASGATAAFNVGGSGEFTSSDIDILKSVGFQSGSFLGFDTTNATSSHPTGLFFQYGNAITNTGGNLGVVKLGSNNLWLTGSNTFTGGLVIKSGGVLSFGNSLSFGGSSGTGTIILGDSSGSANTTLNGGSTYANPISVASGNTGTATITTNQNTTFSGAITLNNHDLTFAALNVLALSGGVTGTGNLVITNSSNLVVNTGPGFNNTGTITNLNGTSATTINQTIGSNVTGIIENSSSSSLTLGAISANATATTLTDTLGQLNITGGVTGTGNLVINNNTSTANGIAFSSVAINNTGTVTNSGTGSGSETISLAIGSNVTGVTQSSANSKLVLTAANSYGTTTTGSTTVTAGTLQLSGSGTLGSTSNSLTVNGGTLDLNGTNQGVGNLTGSGGTIVDNASSNASTLTIGNNNATGGNYQGIIGAGNSALSLTKTGSGTQTISGNNSYSGTTTISAGTLRATTNATALGTGALSLANGATLQLANDTGLNFGRNTTVNGGNGSSATFTSDRLTSGAGVNHTLGTLDINVSGGYQLNVTAGTNVTSGTAGITFGNVTSENSSPTFSAGTGAQLTIGSVSWVTTGNRVIGFTGDGNTVVSGVIHDATGSSLGTSLVKTGNGTLFLTQANTYTNVQGGSPQPGTTIDGGILNAAVFANGGNASSIGEAGSGAGQLIIGGGTLQYTGSTAASTNHLFTIGDNGVETATLDASGTGAGTLSFTNGGSIAFDTNNVAHTLTLTGSNTGANTLSSDIGNSGSGATSLTKTDVGTWVLTGSNGYTGATTINSNGGTLNAGAAGALGSTSSVTVNSGGTLLLSGSGNLNRVNNSAGISLGTTSGAAATLARTGTASEGTGAHTTNGGVSSTGTNAVGLGALTLNSNSTLDFGSGGVGTLVFASFTPNTHVLDILNYTSAASGNNPLVSGTDGTDDRLIFNQDQGPLGNNDLADFSFNGVSATEIALGGGFFEIVPIPEPSTWAAGVLALGLLTVQIARAHAFSKRHERRR